ncbi:hypothetical protein I2I05_13895 [Hymenobacter sp. BT683]|uniref:Uncharacterized protein n=1 Tax=Hymenobacter jeongseonensis TaxID=2791027 RepID=A0ABS0IJE6_9BACT|nr:hypothetical protein [Hymenobacter jeongseonensis]
MFPAAFLLRFTALLVLWMGALAGPRPVAAAAAGEFSTVRAADHTPSPAALLLSQLQGQALVAVEAQDPGLPPLVPAGPAYLGAALAFHRAAAVLTAGLLPVARPRALPAGIRARLLRPVLSPNAP